MSMKRILGMMLASRMAGRGMRGGAGRGGFTGGGLGGLAAMGLLGGRGGGLGRKAGIAALAYMAYRAYQDHQARSGSGQQGSAPNNRQAPSRSTVGRPMGGSTSEAGVRGILGGLIKSASEALGGAKTEEQRASATGPSTERISPGTPAAVGPSSLGTSAPAGRPSEQLFSPEDARAAETLSEETALLLLRAMITAANADGNFSAEERARIMDQADSADTEDRQTLERELANPRPLDELLGRVMDKETAEEFYLASRMAVDGETEANRSYLRKLRERLGLAEQEAAEIDALASSPA